MLNCGIGRGFFDRNNVTPVDFDEKKKEYKISRLVNAREYIFAENSQMLTVFSCNRNIMICKQDRKEKT